MTHEQVAKWRKDLLLKMQAKADEFWRRSEHAKVQGAEAIINLFVNTSMPKDKT